MAKIITKCIIHLKTNVFVLFFRSTAMLDRAGFSETVADLDESGLSDDLRDPGAGHRGMLLCHCSDYLDKEQSGSYEPAYQLAENQDFEER